MKFKAIEGVLLLIVLTYMIATFMGPVPAVVVPTIHVEPSTIVNPGLTAGTSFSVDLAIADADINAGTELYSWQVHMKWNKTILDIDDTINWGDFLEGPRIGPWGTLTSDAVAGQKIINVVDGSKFTSGYTVLIEDDTNSEINTVAAIADNQLTMQSNLAHTYVVEAGGGCYPDPNTTPAYNINHDKGRILVGVTSHGPAPGQSGSGRLASLTFHVLADGETLLTINSPLTFIINDLGQTLGDNDGELTKENGFFSNTGEPPITYDLTISVVGLGTTDPVPGMYTYTEGTVVLVDAFPASGWIFDHWELDNADVGASAIYSVVIDANHTLTAFFLEENPSQWTLTVYSDPVEGIEFTVDGATYAAPWSALLDEGSYTIVVPPIWMVGSDVYSFDHWEDSSPNPTRTVILAFDTTVAAHYVLELPPPGQSVLTIGVVGSGTTNPAPGVYMREEGTVVDVDAVPDNGWILDHWELDSVDVGAADTYSVTMDANHMLTVFFFDAGAPIADAGPDQTTSEGVRVTFDGSASYDENGIVSYTWVFTDLTQQTLDGVSPFYTFTTPGTYYVTLTVENAAGSNAKDMVVITVLADTDRDGTPDITDIDDDNDARAHFGLSSEDAFLPWILIVAALVGAGIVSATLLWRRASQAAKNTHTSSRASELS